MFSLIKNLFTGGGSVGKVVAKGIELGDELVLTKEENAEMFLRFVAASTGSNQARRLLAVIIAAMWVQTLLVLPRNSLPDS